MYMVFTLTVSSGLSCMYSYSYIRIQQFIGAKDPGWIDSMDTATVACTGL